MRFVELDAVGLGALGDGLIKQFCGFVSLLFGPVDHHPIFEIDGLLDSLAHLLHEIAVSDIGVSLSELDLLVPDLVAVDGDRGLELDVELGLAGLELDVLRMFVGAFHALLRLELGEHGQVLHEVAVGLHVLSDAADLA